jgi:hypothetical protein
VSVRSARVINATSRSSSCFPHLHLNAFVPSDTTAHRPQCECSRSSTGVCARISTVRNLFRLTPPNSPIADSWAQQNRDHRFDPAPIVLLGVFIAAGGDPQSSRINPVSR